MKSPKLLLLLVAAIGLICCKKESLPVGDYSRFKIIKDDYSMNKAIGDLAKGYKIESSDYNEFDEHPDPSSDFYHSLWSRSISGHPELFHKLDLKAQTTTYPVPEMLDDSYLIIVDDSRLRKPPYRNVYVAKQRDGSDFFWNYYLFIDSYDNYGYNQIAILQGHFYGYDRDSAKYAPQVPSDRTVVTALLGLLEPVPNE